MDKYLKLAKILLGIWEAHDLRDFNLLSARLEKLLKITGYENKKRDKMIKYITRAYESHAEIDDIIPEKEEEKIIKVKSKPYEDKIIKSLSTALNSLQRGNPNLIAKHHAKWWMNFLLKNKTGKKKYYFKIMFHIFLEHYRKIGKFIPSVVCSYYLIMGGQKGHDERSQNKGEKYLRKYWKKVLKYDTNEPLMF